VPQVLLHRGSFQVAYSNPRYATVAFSMQALSLQYNDDQNVQFIPAATLAQAGYTGFSGPGLPGYASYDFTIMRDVGRYVQVFYGIQNMFDKVSFVQTNPSTTGTPRLMNVGVRVRLSADRDWRSVRLRRTSAKSRTLRLAADCRLLTASS
jgi:hypothetical protein